MLEFLDYATAIIRYVLSLLLSLNTVKHICNMTGQKRAYFSCSTTIIPIKKEPLQYKMKWCRLKNGCNFLSLKDEVNRKNNKRMNK